RTVEGPLQRVALDDAEDEAREDPARALRRDVPVGDSRERDREAEGFGVLVLVAAMERRHVERDGSHAHHRAAAVARVVRRELVLARVHERAEASVAGCALREELFLPEEPAAS